MTKSQALIDFWRHEEQAIFEGWDFSYLDGRMLEELPPWSYEQLATGLMADAVNMLDMGTGGGERLLLMRAAWPETVVATEGYPPNVKLARKTLTPFGVEVFDVPGEVRADLPFENGRFDLIINRQTGYGFFEVARVLKENGRFLTQQIETAWAYDLKRAFGIQLPPKEPSLMRALRYLIQTDLWVEHAQSWTGSLSFTDVGAIVYYLKAIPWLVEGFSVETHLPYLLKLQEKVDRGEELKYCAAKYLIQAKKPAFSNQ
ncbi:MAG: class I SAM-dependent methyltransferase [Anaerolineae bacterium]|nr:class I SAM-dependent methyltransferase [Anaerolineae bacterium]